jgi:hypothetical protein
MSRTAGSPGKLTANESVRLTYSLNPWADDVPVTARTSAAIASGMRMAHSQHPRARRVKVCQHTLRAGMRLIFIIGSLMLLTASGGPAAAQERPQPSVELGAGWVGFADDGIVNEAMFGVAARWYALPRISLGPEIVYISGPSHSHLTVTGNVTYDLLAARSGQPRRVTPFLVAGGGLFQTRQTFFTGDFTSNEGAFTAGGGVRASTSDRVEVGVDVRVGWELHLRANGFVGVRLGR